MPDIHPTAAVGPDAEIADNVAIGPYCTIEGPVTIGPGTRLLHHVTLYGPLRIGAGNTIYPNACIGFAPQHRGYDPASPGAGVVIGDDNVIREGVTIHRATGERPTTLGRRNYLMVNSHLGHDARAGDDCTLANGVLLGGHVEVHDGAILGGNAGVQQFARVGRLAMLSGGAVLTQDLPPFCVAYTSRLVGSLNIIGLRRAALREHIPCLKRAFDLLYHSGLPNPAAAQRIDEQLGHDPLCRELAEFIRTTKRGLSAYARSGAGDG